MKINEPTYLMMLAAYGVSHITEDAAEAVYLVFDFDRWETALFEYNEKTGLKESGRSSSPAPSLREMDAFLSLGQEELKYINDNLKLWVRMNGTRDMVGGTVNNKELSCGDIYNIYKEYEPSVSQLFAKADSMLATANMNGYAPDLSFVIVGKPVKLFFIQYDIRKHYSASPLLNDSRLLFCEEEAARYYEEGRKILESGSLGKNIKLENTISLRLKEYDHAKGILNTKNVVLAEEGSTPEQMEKPVYTKLIFVYKDDVLVLMENNTEHKIALSDFQRDSEYEMLFNGADYANLQAAIIHEDNKLLLLLKNENNIEERILLDIELK